MTQNTSRVYAIAGAGLVKIGYTYSVANHLQGLRNMSPVPLELLASGVGREKEERALHIHFSEQRRHGEWFELDDTQLESLVTIIKHPESLVYLVNKYISHKTSPISSNKKGGSVRIGTQVQCKYDQCGKTFRATSSLRSYCCAEHRALAHGRVAS